jgi:hypothetical protein
MSQVNECIWQVSQIERGRPDDVDGDEEPRSGGVALVDKASDGVGIGDAQPVEVVVDPPAGADAAGDAEQAARAEQVDELPDETSADDGVVPAAEAPDEAGVVPAESTDADPQEQAENDSVAEAADVPAPRRRSTLRRGAVVGALALVVALAVSAFATSGSPTGDVDQRFLDATRSQGLVVAGGQQQTLLVSAARKICERRESHETAAQRRATALSIEELRSVARTFGDDARGFTSLALETYCPN